ncbi:MAG: rhomboid family intramembrane serine protease [Myxococcota bacterium]
MFFPIRDDNPRPGTPFVVIGLIALNALVFLYQLSLGDERGELFVRAAGAIPFELTHLLDLTGWRVEGRRLVAHPHALVPLPLTAVTAMFLHGGWLHLLGNMWYLWLFGDNIEDQMGIGRFAVFYLVCGLAAAALQVAVEPASTIPMIGASGAIAGVLGGYARMFPRARVHTIVILFFIQHLHLPAILLLGFWFLLQFVSAAGGGAGVAWYAHIGGFIAGFLLVGLFVRRSGPPTRDRRWAYAS